MREITFREAVVEALDIAMQRDPRVFLLGEDIWLLWRSISGNPGASPEIRRRPGHGQPDLRDRYFGRGHRVCHCRHAARRGDYEYRFSSRLSGPARQPGGQDALHVWRPVQDPHGRSYHLRGGPGRGCPSRPGDPCRLHALSGIEDCLRPRLTMSRGCSSRPLRMRTRSSSSRTR